MKIKLPTSAASLSLACTIAIYETASSSTLAINWGGDYVSNTALWADHVPGKIISGSDSYGDPFGPFVTDSDGDGPDDSIAGRALDLANPFSPSSGYSGTSDTFYGGESVSRENSPSVNDGFSELSIISQGPNDSIHYHVDTGGDSHTFHLLTYWDKSDFLNGLNSEPSLFLDTGEFTLSTAQSSGHHTDELLYWVIRDGSQFYISEDTIALSNNSDYSVPYSSLTNWAPYNPVDPAGSPTAADLWSLDFDETSVFTPHIFTDVTALGFYVEHEAATGPVHVHIEGFSASASAVPEPSTALLGLLGTVGLILRRRR